MQRSSFVPVARGPATFRASAVLSLLAMLSACATTHVVGPTAVDEVRALERARMDAMVAADEAVLERLFADDLQYGHSTGSVQGKAALIATLRAGALDYLSIKPRTLDVRAFEGGALASGTADVEATAGARHLKGALRWLAVYARRDGRWQLVAYQSTALPAG